jgi:hypothetical protein
MAILKYGLVVIGYGMYVFVNVLSYTHPSFPGPFETKIIFSLLSLFFLTIDSLILLFPEKITKRTWKELSLYTRISVVLGVLILPLISLYYS